MMENSAALPGKLTRPAGNRLLARERLFALLDTARGSRLIWVSGPAGAGKTSLVSSWIEARRLTACWYQVDGRDADPATVFHYLRIHASAAGRERVDLPHLGPDHLHSVDAFARRFFERFFASLSTPFALVLDDVQCVPREAPFHAVVAHAIQVLPQGALLICLSREDPAPALARWIVDPSFFALGWEQLQLDEGEAQAFARLDGTFDAESVARMNASARGWAAGMRLLLRGSSLEGLSAGHTQAPQALFDYLASEVLSKLPPATRDLLLKTAILPAATASMARRLSGVADADAILGRLHRGRLFVSRRESPHQELAYEFHPLFRAFLQAQASAQLSAAEHDALLGAAASIAQEAGEIDVALSIYARRADWCAYERLVAAAAPGLLSQGRNQTLEAWIVAIPEPERAVMPEMLYALGRACMAASPALGRQRFEDAFEAYERAGDDAGALRACAAVLEALALEFRGMSRSQAWIARLERHIDKLGAHLPPSAEMAVIQGIAGLVGPHIAHPLVDRLAARAMALLPALPDAEQKFAAARLPAELYMLRGELGLVDQILAELDLAPGAGTPLLRLGCESWLIATHWLRGEFERALAAVERALALCDASGVLVMDTRIRSQAVYAAIGMGDLAKAQGWLEQIGPAHLPAGTFDEFNYRFLCAGMALARGDAAQALRIASSMLPRVEAGGCQFGIALHRLLIANSLALTGEVDAARAQLEPAFDYAQRARSRGVEFAGRVTLAFAMFEAGRDALGLEALRTALPIGRELGYMTWYPFWSKATTARLCARALDAGVEVDYVQRLIAKRALLPDEHAGERWPRPLRLHTLGAFELTRDREPVRSSGRAQQRVLELLQAIIALGGRSVSIDTLAGALWPDTEGDAAQGTFDVTVHRLRKLLGCDGALQVRERKVGLNPAQCWIDVWEFERLADEVERLASGAADAPDAPRLDGLTRRLLDLYAGHFLASEGEAAWLLPKRAALRRRFARCVALLGARLEQSGQRDTACTLYHKALELDPVAEDTYRRLMQCLVAQRRVPEALVIYSHCRNMLSALLNVAPSAATQAIVASLRRSA